MSKWVVGIVLVLVMALVMAGNDGGADYALINPPAADDAAARLVKMDAEARAAEFKALQQYEQEDFNFMARGVVLEPVEEGCE